MNHTDNANQNDAMNISENANFEALNIELNFLESCSSNLAMKTFSKNNLNKIKTFIVNIKKMFTSCLL